MLDQDKLQVVEKNINLSLTPEREAQKIIYKRVYDFYRGRFIEHLETIFYKQFSDVSSAIETMIKTDVGFTSQIPDTLALVYKETPKRQFYIEDKLIENQLSDYLNAIYESFGNQTFQTINALVKCFGTLGIRLKFLNGKFQLQILTPDSFDVITNNEDSSIADAIFYKVDNLDTIDTKKNQVVTYVYFDNDEHLTLELKANNNNSLVIHNTNFIGENKDSKNPFGVIPFIFIRDKTPVNEFFIDTNARKFDSGEQTLIYKQIGLNETVWKQGFSILYLKTKNKINGADNYVVAPDKIAILEVGNSMEGHSEELGVVNFNAPINDLSKDYIETYKQQAGNFGIDNFGGSSNSNSSGVSIFLSDDSKNTVINKDRSKYKAFEQELFNLLRVINNYYVGKETGRNLMSIPDNISLQVNFNEIVTKLSPSDQAEQEQHDLDNKLITRSQILIKRDPELTEKQAKELITNIDKETKEEQKLILNIDTSETETEET